MLDAGKMRRGVKAGSQAQAMMQLTPTLMQLVKTAAEKYGVSADLSENDYILQFLANHFENPKDAITYYFDNGRESAERFIKILEEFRLPKEIHILEFASGYGCVTRHLPSLMPGAKIVASDIHEEAISLVSRLGIETLLSAHEPEDFSPPMRFDVVFALSFFTHMPEATWRRWLDRLTKCAKPGGYLVFTTNGRRSLPGFDTPVVSSDGYYFVQIREQQDVPQTEYGSTITFFEYVHKQVASIPELQIVKFQEGFWYDGRQDVYVIRCGDPEEAPSLDVLKAELSRVALARDGLIAQVGELRGEIYRLTSELRNLRGQGWRSWRIVAPLRWLVRALRRYP